MLRNRNGCAIECLSSELNERILNDKAESHNYGEILISEDILERVKNVFLEISTVEFIEELEQHKCLKKYSAMSCCLWIEFINIQMLEFRNNKQLIYPQ